MYSLTKTFDKIYSYVYIQIVGHLNVTPHSYMMMKGMYVHAR